MTMLTYERKLVNLNMRQELTFLYKHSLLYCMFIVSVPIDQHFIAITISMFKKKENLINDTNVLDNVD